MALFFYKEKNKDIRAAAYLRLSIEDGDKAESNSICDFYDSAGGRQCGGIFGTGGSNNSASMVHIRRGET